MAQINASLPEPSDFDDAASVITDTALAHCSDLEREIAGKYQPGSTVLAGLRGALVPACANAEVVLVSASSSHK